MNKFLLKNRLHDYVDGELPSDERREVEAALNQYPDLMKEVEDIQEQRNSMLNIGQLKAPESLLDSILMDIESIPVAANTARSKKYLPFVTIAAAALIAWMLIPTIKTDIESPVDVKGAQVLIPSANPVKLPTTSPIEEANKHLDELQAPVEEPEPPQTAEERSPPIAAKSPSNKPKSGTPTFVIKTPDSPYVPEWEEKHVIEVATTEFTSDAFQFRSAPANLLFQLDSLAQSVGGSIQSTNGGPFSTVELTNFSPRAQCELWVPIEAVEKVNQQLTDLGGQFFDETIRQSDGYAIFKIDARYKYY